MVPIDRRSTRADSRRLRSVQSRDNGEATRCTHEAVRQAGSSTLSRSQPWRSLMDLIASLTSQLGIDSDKAQGLAGVVLGKLEEQVGQKLGGGDAAALRDQVPELSDWKAKGAALDASSSG